MHGQLRANLAGRAAGMWLGVSFPNDAGQMVGSTVVIGTQTDGVALYAWEAEFVAAILPLDNSWQTLSAASYTVQPNGESILTFSKRLDENEYDLQVDRHPHRPRHRPPSIAPS